MKSYNDGLKEIIKILTENNKTISCMESCTGGGLANAITSIEGASNVLKFSAVTYSNQFKIKMGVDENIIDEYSVYSIETAKDMSKAISIFTDSDYGVGITGKLNRIDKDNPYGEDNVVYYSIYSKEDESYFEGRLEVYMATREENKDLVIGSIVEDLLEII